MNSIKASLLRKLGPLPAWAWLAFFAVAVVAYRRLRTKADPTSTSGEVVDDTSQSRDPVTVAPGEGVYDPNTGQFKSQAPDQIRLDPVTVEPGEAIYDPTTGKFIRNVDPKAAGKKKKPKKKKNPHFGTPRVRDLIPPKRFSGRGHPHDARGVKHKPQHSSTHGKIARQPANGATRPRGAATILHAFAQVPNRAPGGGTPPTATAMVTSPPSAVPHTGPPTAGGAPTEPHTGTPTVAGGTAPKQFPTGPPKSATAVSTPRPRTTVNPTVVDRERPKNYAPPRAPVRAHPAAPAHAVAKSPPHMAAPPAPKQKRR